eukprot:287434-Chlamydomonas_euryale.AAC.1
MNVPINGRALHKGRHDMHSQKQSFFSVRIRVAGSGPTPESGLQGVDTPSDWLWGKQKQDQAGHRKAGARGEGLSATPSHPH